jgi:3-phosphoshikimate 1-carboxyvinyltransferase
MRLLVRPGSAIDGTLRVPGDKSIAHRWLILAATARGGSSLRALPPSLDVRSTAACLAELAPKARPQLDAWASNVRRGAEANGFTWDAGRHISSSFEVEVQADGRDGLTAPSTVLDCGNSGTTMRLLAGVLAGASFGATLTGDVSLSARPMERVAEPLRAMGARVRTSDGHSPVEIVGGGLRGIVYSTPVPSAQLKGAVLLAGCAAEGETEVLERAATRDHTERALAALGIPIESRPGFVRVSAFQHGGFEGTVPGDVSSAAFLIGAAAVTGGSVQITGVGLNRTRTRFLEVYRRMGVEVETLEHRDELGEPVGDLVARGPSRLVATTVDADELPLVIDEVPVLAAVASSADGVSRFAGASELRVKESDRLGGIAATLRSVGSEAAVEGDDLVISGGGAAGGIATANGDHRIAMAAAVAALGASGSVTVDGIEAADVSFPGFADALRAVGADVEVAP